MERPSSVPCMSLPRPLSPYSGKLPLNSSEEALNHVSLQHLADIKKENFSLKLKIYYLETTLTKVSGAEEFNVLNENVQLKVENESILKELATNKDLLIKASSLVESLSSNQSSNQNGVALQQENEELQKLITNLEHALAQDSNIITEGKDNSCSECDKKRVVRLSAVLNQKDIIDSGKISQQLDLNSSSTIKLTDFILLCANNWLDELPELMKALRDAIHSSIVDCQSVQTRIKERRATWVDKEVGRLSARLDAVYRLLHHVETLSVQQPPSKVFDALQQDVHSREREVRSLNDKLVKRTRDINKLRMRMEEQDRLREKHRISTNTLSGLNPSLLGKVIDTESVLREAHKSLEKRMVVKEGE